MELYDKLSAGSNKMAGAAAAVTMKMDVDEIGQAEKIVKLIQKRLKAASREYADLLQDSKKWSGDIARLKKQYDAALRAYESAAGKFKSSQRKREELLKEFKQWKQTPGAESPLSPGPPPCAPCPSGCFLPAPATAARRRGTRWRPR